MSKRKRQVSDSDEESLDERDMDSEDEYETDSDYETPSESESGESDSDDDDNPTSLTTPRINVAEIEQIERKERDTAARLERMVNIIADSDAKEAQETKETEEEEEQFAADAIVSSNASIASGNSTSLDLDVNASETKENESTSYSERDAKIQRQAFQPAVIRDELDQDNVQMDTTDGTTLPEPVVAVVVPEDVFVEMKDDMWRLTRRDTGLPKSWIIEPVLSSEAEQRILCPICQEIVWDPFRFNGCGHLLCRCCAEQVESRHAKGATYVCPKCKSPTNTGPEEVKDVIVRSLFAELRIKCPGISPREAEKSESFCKLEMSYWDSFGHLKKCPYETIVCECGERMRRGCLAKHVKETCLFRKIDCEYCSECMSAYDYDDHKANECVAAPHASIWCKVCKVYIKDGQFIKHITDQMIKHARYMSGNDVNNINDKSASSSQGGKKDVAAKTPLVNGKDEKKTTNATIATSSQVGNRHLQRRATMQYASTSSTVSLSTASSTSSNTLGAARLLERKNSSVDTDNMSSVELARSIVIDEFLNNEQTRGKIQTLSGSHRLFIADISDGGYCDSGTLVCSTEKMYNGEDDYRPEQWIGQMVEMDAWNMLRGKVEGVAYFDRADKWMAMVRWADGDCYMHELVSQDWRVASNTTIRLAEDQTEAMGTFVTLEPHPERLRYRHYESRKELSEAQVKELSTAVGIKTKLKRERKRRLAANQETADSIRRELFGSLSNSSEVKTSNTGSGSIASASGSGSGSIASESGSGSGSVSASASGSGSNASGSIASASVSGSSASASGNGSGSNASGSGSGSGSNTSASVAVAPRNKNVNEKKSRKKSKSAKSSEKKKNEDSDDFTAESLGPCGHCCSLVYDDSEHLDEPDLSTYFCNQDCYAGYRLTTGATPRKVESSSQMDKDKKIKKKPKQKRNYKDDSDSDTYSDGSKKTKIRKTKKHKSGSCRSFSPDKKNMPSDSDDDDDSKPKDDKPSRKKDRKKRDKQDDDDCDRKVRRHKRFKKT